MCVCVCVCVCVILLVYSWQCRVLVATQTFSSCRGHSLAAVHGLLTAVASLVSEQGLRGSWTSEVAARGLGSCGSQSLEHRLNGSGISCPSTGGILPDQGSNPCLLHWQVDSLPLSHQQNLIKHLNQLKI